MKWKSYLSFVVMGNFKEYLLNQIVVVLYRSDAELTYLNSVALTTRRDL